MYKYIYTDILIHSVSITQVHLWGEDELTGPVTVEVETPLIIEYILMTIIIYNIYNNNDFEIIIPWRWRRPLASLQSFIGGDRLGRKCLSESGINSVKAINNKDIPGPEFILSKLQ